MKIGILGSGDVGRRLADGLLDLGYQVKIWTRDTSKKEIIEWIDKHRKGDKELENASVGGFAEAASLVKIWSCSVLHGTELLML